MITTESQVTTPRSKVSTEPSLVIAGQRLRQSSDLSTIDFPTGRQVQLAVATEDFVARFKDRPKSTLPSLKLHEITSFLYNVGQNWKNPSYSPRAIYEGKLVEFLGYSREMAKNEADWIAVLLSSNYRIYDLLNVELGSWQILDNWVLREEAWIRAFPHGLALHVLPGNVPLSAVLSVLRAIVTKNESLVKVSARDPFTTMALVRSFVDVDPGHPVTRSLSVAYWPSDKTGDTATGLAAMADVVLAWGGQDAITWCRRSARADAEVLVFGPKRSFSIVGEGADLKSAARNVSIDASMYDQRACFSTREVFVHRSIAADFVTSLKQAFQHLESIFPKGASSLDEAADQALQRAHAGFLGWDLVGERTPWAILRRPPTGAEPHCLGRTIYVSEFSDPAEIYPHCGHDVQTVSVTPWESSSGLRDQLGARGVSRIVDCGMNNVFRVGGAHDGFYPFQRLVRLTANELPRSVFLKGANLNLDQTELLETGRFLDFIS
jgi:long-chain-fatty-acyl-CoA reductase